MKSDGHSLLGFMQIWQYICAHVGSNLSYISVRSSFTAKTYLIVGSCFQFYHDSLRTEHSWLQLKSVLSNLVQNGSPS